MQAPLMPAFYIAHGGGPCFFMDWSPIGPKDTWYKMERWLRGLAQTLPRQPTAIVVISAHWETPQFSITAKSNPKLLFDYSGFPKETYELTYPAQGDFGLSKTIESLLSSAGLNPRMNHDRDFDHGVFIPLKLIYPEANIPIVQVSLRTGLDPEEHFRLGHALAPLRTQGVLLIGSGMSYHNLGEFFSGQPSASLEFDTWLTDAVESPDLKKRKDLLLRWKGAPGARRAHPREEHLIPLHVIAGSSDTTQGTKIFSDTIMGQKISAYSM